ncbi:MAG: rhodanese-like domain-containing protein [Rhodospirillaceae bacterium]
MFFQRIKTPGIAHVAYIVAENGLATIVDPGRDVERYLKVLRNNGLRLGWILATHRQEDFEMGGATLRRLTGAEIVACDHEYTAHADRRLVDGDEMELAEGIAIRALHVPGHTPESMAYAVTLADAPEGAWAVFTGDAMFIGDTGRTDLADAARTAENAALLYDHLHAKILPLGDQALVLPAHGAGSACGGNVADRDHSTIGIERATNAVAVKSRDAFVRHKASEGLARPPYFRLMEAVNLEGGRTFEDTPVDWPAPQEFERRSTAGIVVDTRPAEAFAGGHIPNAYSIWLAGMARYGGWVADPATPVYLVADDPAAMREARLALARIGHDNVGGALAGGFEAWRNAGLPVARSGTIVPRTLADDLGDYAVLDTREAGEVAAGGCIPDAVHVFVGHLEAEIDGLGLDRDRPVVATCSVGHRGSLAVSILERKGYRNAFNLLGGMTAWKRLGLPLEEPPSGFAKRMSTGA